MEQVSIGRDGIVIRGSDDAFVGGLALNFLDFYQKFEIAFVAYV